MRARGLRGARQRPSVPSGVASGAAVEVRDLRVEPPTIPLGGSVRLRFAIVSTGEAPQDLVIDYVVPLARKNGAQTPKVSKLARRTLGPGETLALSKTQSFAPISLRRYYAGPHAIAVQVNGAILAQVPFEVRG